MSSINPHDDAALNRVALQNKSAQVTLRIGIESVTCSITLARKIITIFEKGGEQVASVEIV